MEKIYFAIVGCGHIAHKHITAIQNIREAELIAVCDVNRHQLQQFEDTYNVKGYLDLEEMLQKEKKINVVNICTPSGLHKKLALQVTKYKKHLIIEKPLALTVEDCDMIIQACNDANVKLSVVHPNRFRPAIIKLKAALDNGWFGKISHVNATVRWNRNQEYYDQASWRGTKEFDGGVLMNQAIHSLDLLIWLMEDIDEVQSYTATRLRKIETEDVAVGIVKFKNGALCTIEAATTIYPKNLEESISVFGEKGSMIVGGSTANWIKHCIFEEISESVTNQIIQSVEEDPYGISGHQHIIKDMVDAVRLNETPLVTGIQGRDAVKFVQILVEANKHKAALKWDSIL